MSLVETGNQEREWVSEVAMLGLDWDGLKLTLSEYVKSSPLVADEAH